MNISGNSSGKISHSTRTAIIEVTDNVYGLASISFEGTGTTESTIPTGLNLADLPSGTSSVIVTRVGLALGEHSVTATNNNDLSSSGEWDVVAVPDIELVSAAGGHVGEGAFTVTTVVDTAGGNETIFLNSTAVLERGESAELTVSSGTTVRSVFTRNSAGTVATGELTFDVGQINPAFVDEVFDMQGASPGSPGYFIADPPSGAVTVSGVQHAFASGGVGIFGTFEDPMSGTTYDHDNTEVLFSIPAATRAVDAAIGFTQKAGIVRINGAGPEEIEFTVFVDAEGDPSYNSPDGGGEFEFPLEITIEVDTSTPHITVLDEHCVTKSSDGTRCFVVWDFRPSVTFVPTIYAARVSLGNVGSGGGGAPVYEGTTGLTLAPGVSISGLTATDYGLFTLNVRTEEPEIGYRGTESVTTYEIIPSSSSFFTGSYTVNLDVGISSGSSGRRRIIVDDQNGGCGYTELGADTGAGVAVSTNGASRFGVALREFDYFVSAGPVRFMSNVSSVTATSSVSGAGHDQAISVFRAGGMVEGGPSTRLNPTGATFSPAGVLKLCYSDNNLAAAGIGDSWLKLYQFNESGQQEELAEQVTNTNANYVNARVSSLSSIFNVFGPTVPVPADDLLAPRTTIQFDVAVTTTFGQFFVTAPAHVSFSALDPPFSSAPVSGVSQIRYAIDPVSFSTASMSVYSSPVPLPIGGSHVIYFYAVDVAGNVEAVHVATAVVERLPIQSFAIAADPAGRLWEVFEENGSMRLSQFDRETLISSTTLPGALDGFWSIAFSSGLAYAVGVSTNEYEAPQVAVYRVNAAGSLVSSATFTTGEGFEDFSLDAGGEVWISGATAGEEGVQLALWRFCPHAGTLSLKATYSRGGGFDSGHGIAVDSEGLWVAGYSKGTGEEDPLDLALWRFNSTGTLVAGPYFRPNYMSEFDFDTSVRVRIGAGGVHVAAHRLPESAPQQLAMVRFGTDGAVLSERVWAAADERDIVIGNISVSSAGVFVAGGLREGTTSHLAVWSYDASGALTDARLKVSLPNAWGIVRHVGETWLAVNAYPKPYLYTGGSALSGTSTLLSSAPANLVSLSIVPSSATLEIGATAQLLAAGTYSDGSTRAFTVMGEVSWASDEPEIATVTALGLSTAVAEGTAIIAASSGAVIGYSTITVEGGGEFLRMSGGGGPSIYSLSPASAPIGAPVELSGEGFGRRREGRPRVLLNGTTAQVVSWKDDKLTFKVPPSLSSGTYDLAVERMTKEGEGTLGGTVAFEVLRPVITSMTPVSGLPKTLVTMTGTGFGPAMGTTRTRVLLGGTTVAVSVWTDTLIRWKVPKGLAVGTHTVVIIREPAGGYVASAPIPFGVGSPGGFGTSALSFEAPLTTLPDSWFEAEMNLLAEEGGRVESPVGALVDVPAGSLEKDEPITVRKAADDDHRDGLIAEAGLSAAGPPLELGGHGLNFALPVTIEMPFDAAAAGPRGEVAIHYFDPATSVWKKLDSQVDLVRGVVSARTDHFSLYQALTPFSPSAAADEFGLRDQYAFPNPSRQGQAVVFRIQPGLADSVEVRVYDISGRKLHESTAFTLSTLFDDGNGKGVQHTYDHRWDVSGVGSGVYHYVIIARRAGHSPISVRGKAGVIK